MKSQPKTSLSSSNLHNSRAQKEQKDKTNSNVQINTKIVADMKSENDALRDPLEKKQQERDNLRSLLRQFPKHKMSLSNLKQKLIVLKDKIQKLKNDRQDLDFNYDQVLKFLKGHQRKTETWREIRNHRFRGQKTLRTPKYYPGRETQ